MQILVGPRQVGKTTAILQVAASLRRRGYATVLAEADAVASPPADWIREHWRRAVATARGGRPTLLALDEVQKIPGWSEVVKQESDALQRLPVARRPRVVLSGSSALLVERGLTESLAGRFELLRFPHWGFDEERRAFRWDLRTHVCLGGYPRLRDFAGDPDRFLGSDPAASLDLALGEA
jgi:hypothetical protein